MIGHRVDGDGGSETEKVEYTVTSNNHTNKDKMIFLSSSTTAHHSSWIKCHLRARRSQPDRPPIHYLLDSTSPRWFSERRKVVHTQIRMGLEKNPTERQTRRFLCQGLQVEIEPSAVVGPSLGPSGLHLGLCRGAPAR